MISDYLIWCVVNDPIAEIVVVWIIYPGIGSPHITGPRIVTFLPGLYIFLEYFRIP